MEPVICRALPESMALWRSLRVSTSFLCWASMVGMPTERVSFQEMSGNAGLQP